VAVFSKWISRQEALNDEVQSCSTLLPRPAPLSAARLLAIVHESVAVGCVTDVYLQDHLRIWKALFYCFWMSDKVPVQRELAERLAGLINVCPNQEQTEHFIRAFYRTMQREWGGIDRLRMDKFYNLIRCFQRETFVYLAKSHWRSESIAWVNAILTKGPIGLDAEGAAGHVSKTPGLQLHMVDIFLEEVTEALNQGITAETWMLVLEPYIQLLGSAVDKAVFERVYERVFKELAGKKWLAASIEQEDEDEAAFKSKKLRVCIVPLVPS
jgi:ribosomal RNA-processing protein 1